MLAIQTVSNIFYLYPLLYLFYGDERFSIVTIAFGLFLCICFLISYVMLLCKDPGKLRSEESESYSVRKLQLLKDCSNYYILKILESFVLNASWKNKNARNTAKNVGIVF